MNPSRHLEAVSSKTDGGPTLHRLVADQGVRRYALFFVTGEGRTLPNGEEEVSGSLVTSDGRCFGFWTGWDAVNSRPAFSEWYEETPDEQWLTSDEYRRARAAVGLE